MLNKMGIKYQPVRSEVPFDNMADLMVHIKQSQAKLAQQHAAGTLLP